MTDEQDIPGTERGEFTPKRVVQWEGQSNPIALGRAMAADREAMRRAYAEGRGVSPAELVRRTEEGLSDD